MYHKFDIPKYPSTNIRPEQFEEHLNEFSKTKYFYAELSGLFFSYLNFRSFYRIKD